MGLPLLGTSLSAGVIVLSTCVTLLIWIAGKCYAARSRMKGLPGPPHHWFWGHLKVMGEMRAEHPLDVHPHTYPVLIREKYNLGPVFYLDFWPLGPQSMIIADPNIALQLQQRPKHESVTGFLYHVTGEHNLVSMYGPEWKTWRSIFNPGFAAGHLATLVPAIVEHGEVFCDILQEHMDKDDVFRLEEAATRLTVDVIGQVTLDVKLNTQRGENQLLTAIKNQIAILHADAQPNPLPKLNPFRPVLKWYYAWQMRTYISAILHERFRTRAAQGGGEKNDAKRKHIIDLALETYFAEERADVAVKDQKLDPTFERYAIDQIRVFMFAGHDTTSSTICYVLHMLETHPEALARVTAEHNEVFGGDPSEAADLMRANPHLLNKLDYTLAVIKEVLRMYPVASSIRKGDASFFITDPQTSTPLPTANMMLWILHIALHRHAPFFPSPHTFLPTRFLPDPPFPIPEHSYRPFEKGPRACIGQELALLEVKVIAVLVVRRWAVQARYGELEKVAGDGQGWPRGEEGGSVWGDVAYQTWRGTAKPRQGMPCRVRVR